MPTLQCPIKGFEKISVTWPDNWTVRHHDQFYMAYHEAKEETDMLITCLIFGCAAICATEGIPDDPWEWDRNVATWIVDVVYENDFKKKEYVPIVLSELATSTPKD